MRVRTILGTAAGVTSAAVAVPSIYLALRLRHEGFSPEKDRKPQARDLQITAVSDQTVTLRRAAKKPSAGPESPGTYLLEGARGWGYAGRAIDSNDIIAIREYRHGDGELRAGDYVRLDSYAFPSDPYSAHGFPFETVSLASPLGEFSAWHVQGRSDTWAIMTHGKGADRRESLRMMPALIDSGFHCLAITYRNDEGQPAAPNGSYSYGRDEWEELDGAVAYALAHGARDVVLVGYSMGGAITLSFMARSAHAARVSALILDAPMSNLEETVAHGAKLAGIPVRMLSVSNRLAAWRYRFRWSDFDYAQTIAELAPPVLLFHGDADETIPVELSDRIAAARPDIVTYVRVPEAGHVRAWNMEPERYLATVRQFVRTRRSVSTG
jgi:pimeloyl-ACP methyl ester carboxylesterase